MSRRRTSGSSAAQNSGRTAPGRPFPKGQSGNPGGRPRGLTSAVKEKCGVDGRQLIDGLYLIAFGTSAERRAFFGGESVKVTTRDRRECIAELLDRGFGKPQQAVEIGGSGGGPVEVRWVLSA